MSNDRDRVDIGVACAHNSEKYVAFLLETFLLTCSDPTRFRFILGLNGVESQSIVRVIPSGIAAFLIDATVDTGYSSMNHGMCLDLIFQHMSAPTGMIVDCDVAFLRRSWDTEMHARLRDHVVIIGSEYDGEKYKLFPNVIGAMFKTEAIRGLGISFKPEGTTLLTGERLGIYGYPIDAGEVPIILDTGSELPRKVKAAGLSGVPMPLVRAGDPRACFMVEGIRGEEYQLDGVPLFTHLGRSYTREFGVHPDAMAWESRVREWLHAT